MTLASELTRFEELLRSGSGHQIREAIAKLIADAGRMCEALRELEEEADMCTEGTRLVAPKTVRKWARFGLGKSYRGQP